MTNKTTTTSQSSLGTELTPVFGKNYTPLEGVSFTHLPDLKSMTLPEISEAVSSIDDFSTKTIRSIQAANDVIFNKVIEQRDRLIKQPEHQHKAPSDLADEVRAKYNLPSYCLHSSDKYSLEQRMEHTIYLCTEDESIKLIKEVAKSEKEVEDWIDHVRKGWRTTNRDIEHHYYFNTKEGRKILNLSESELKKRAAVLTASYEYNLDLIDLVYAGEMNWRDAYNASRRIRKTIKEYAKNKELFTDFSLSVDQSALSKAKEELKNLFRDIDKQNGDRYYTTDPEAQHKEILEYLHYNVGSLIKISIHDPLEEYHKHKKAEEEQPKEIEG